LWGRREKRGGEREREKERERETLSSAENPVAYNNFICLKTVDLPTPPIPVDKRGAREGGGESGNISG
jgi:hypothetical protein